MSALGDEYTQAAQQLAKLLNRDQIARMGGKGDKAAKLHDEILDMFLKVERLYKQLRQEHSQLSGK